MRSATSRAIDSSFTNGNDSHTADVSVSQEAAVGRRKRPLCSRCVRPVRVCICSALPAQPVEFQKCQVVVLQHPHEARRKNRSMPLVQLCIKGATDDTSQLREELVKKDISSTDFHLRTLVHRRLGNDVDPGIMNMINDPNVDVILIFPGDSAVSLDSGLDEVRRRRIERSSSGRLANRASDPTTAAEKEEKILLIFLDATWSYAREMDRANTFGNIGKGWWPKDIIRVKLIPSKQDKIPIQIALDEVAARTGTFRPNRFEIRTPPSVDHLSTAECLAWVVATIEENPMIYETLLRPLDLMVEKWKSFSEGRCLNRFTDGDGPMEGQTCERRPRPNGNGRRKDKRRKKSNERYDAKN